MSKTKFVTHLPDLIHPADYSKDPESKRVRLRIRISDGGVEILGDAQRPQALEELLEGLSPEEIEKVLCG